MRFVLLVGQNLLDVIRASIIIIKIHNVGGFQSKLNKKCLNK